MWLSFLASIPIRFQENDEFMSGSVTLMSAQLRATALQYEHECACVYMETTALTSLSSALGKKQQGLKAMELQYAD